MNVIDYLKKYKDIPFKEEPFNELDALTLALMSYFPFEYINKKKITPKIINEFLKTYKPEVTTERKLFDIIVLNILCNSIRYKGICFYDFCKKKSGESIEQFQAVTILFRNFMYISYCGTDATVIGWREDFNMSFLDIVPSEVDAINYANQQRKKHPFKDIYIGGHSKGGRLAVRAGKEIYKKNNLKAVFSFDGPNFTDSFYDYKYDEMKSLIYEYAPGDSIVGRLIKDRKKIIVDSSKELIHQHDAYSWLVEDNHFVHLDKYTSRSDKIAVITNKTFYNFDNQTKSIVINTLFDVADSLGIHKLKSGESVTTLVKNIISDIRIEWKNIPKENRKIVLKVLFDIVLIILQPKK